MPNRILRDWTDSEPVDKLSVEAERFFVRLIMKADDFGRFHAEPIRLKSACFPLKDSIRSTDITRWIGECLSAGLVRCYEANGGRYMCIERFNQRLRQMREKFPKPPANKMTVIRPSTDRHTSISFDSDSDSQDQRDGDARGRGFPVTVDDAVAQCGLTAATREFILQCFDLAASRGGKDAKGNVIEDFPAYVRISQTYERSRKAEQNNGNERNRRSVRENPRNAGIVRGPTLYNADTFNRKAAGTAQTPVARQVAENPDGKSAATPGIGEQNL